MPARRATSLLVATFGVIVLTLVPVRTAHAQSAAVSVASVPAVQAQAADPSASITREIALWGGGGYAPKTDFDTSIGLGGGNIAWPITGEHGPAGLRGRLQYGFGVNGVVFDTKGRRAYGGGVDPLLMRWKFSQPSRFVPYLELTAGGVFTNSNVPPGDTSSFNFFPRFSLGWKLASRPQHSLDLSLTFWHLSNATLGDFNPSLNGFQVLLGYHWLKRKAGQTRSH